MALTSGTRLGPHEIVSAIGAGGMGEVYRAIDIALARQVAIKVLPEAFAQDADRLARFEREAKTLPALNHPHIAQIYGIERSSGAPALVLELVDGETLANRIARGPIPLDEALGIAKQITEAPEAAHDQGIVHRDLKPANIKLTTGGVVKVLDFGVGEACCWQRASGSGQRTGVAITDDHVACVDDRGRRAARYRRLHEPGAGERARRRQACRHLGVWLRALRDAHRCTSIRGGHLGGRVWHGALLP